MVDNGLDMVEICLGVRFGAKPSQANLASPRCGVSTANFLITTTKNTTVSHAMTSITEKIDLYMLDSVIREDTVVHTTGLVAGTRVPFKTTWKREKFLGSGAFGSVWREKEEQSEKLRAVKVISKLQLNVREVEALVALQDVSLRTTYFLFAPWTLVNSSRRSAPIPIRDLSRLVPGSIRYLHRNGIYRVWRFRSIHSGPRGNHGRSSKANRFADLAGACGTARERNLPPRLEAAGEFLT